MKKGKLYGLGVGPGDPELLTLKAVRLLNEADVIAVPDKGHGEKTALKIVEAHTAGKELLFCPTPMVRDRALLDTGYSKIADTLCALLDAGKTVAFITLGDPTIYSTYYYVHKLVAERGYEAELIPGVPSFCAVAAKLGVSLCERSQRLLIVPASADATDTLNFPANRVYMKAGKSLMDLQSQLREAGELDRAAMVANCGMENEQVYPAFGEADENCGYYAVVIVKEAE